MPAPATEAARAGMVASYLSGLSMQDSAARFGHTGPAAHTALRKAGIAVRGLSESHRRYKVDEGFFDHVDSGVKAYWLGFITGDGCVWNKALSIRLRAHDADHLRRFIGDLHSDYPVHTFTDTRGIEPLHGSGIRITSSRLVGALAALGVGPNKTHVVRPCTALSGEVEPDYWRGLFDADGCISRRNGQGCLAWQHSVSWCGTRAMMEGLHRFLAGRGVSKTPVAHRGTTWHLRFSGVALPQKIMQIIGYTNPVRCLARKQQLVAELLSLPIRGRPAR